MTTTIVTSVEVRDLTGMERTVALYASDMPNQRRRHAKDQIRAWIVQGAERVGVDELRRRAEYFRGWRLLDLNGQVTPQIQARHEQRFPRPKRLEYAESQATNTLFTDGISEAARRRNDWAVVDGDCPCGDTGDIAAWGSEGPAMLCPVHHRAEIDAFHRARRAAR
ncbi:hypothetical protein ACH4PW_32130 [Streptomyces sp. NPDC017082]|uniref:hypothetical protein n=1 Tax=Streptomyces sp. NPDC017082 TaxID=3364974 RepID=UPI0037B70C2C